MGKNGNLSDFERSMVVQAIFSHTIISKVYREQCGKGKISRKQQQCLDSRGQNGASSWQEANDSLK